MNTINRQGIDPTISAGFSLIEILVLVAVLAIVTAIGAPMYVSFQRAQETDGAARTLVTALNQARQLAIARNASFSVELQTAPQNQFRFCSGTTTPCPAGTVWVGPGSGAAGWVRLDNEARIVLGPRITFNSLGAATASGTLRVQNSSQTSCLDVAVNPSGGARITAAAACP